MPSLLSLGALSLLVVHSLAPVAASPRRHHHRHHSHKSSMRTSTTVALSTAKPTTTSAAAVVDVTTTPAAAVTTTTSASAVTTTAPAPILAAPVANVAGPEGTVNMHVDFSTYKSGSVASFLEENGLYISDYPVGSTPLSHTFTPDNVAISNGALTLTVRGQSGDGDVSSAEVATQASMKYGNITTRARTSNVAGVCSAMFFYGSDNLEIDIEILTSYITTGYGDAVPPGIEFSNQSLQPGGKSTNVAVPYPSDPSAAFHDYTIVWASDSTKFYIDGVLLSTLNTNVPSTGIPFIWNNWSSGDPYWSAGPPSADNVMEISSITGWYYAA